MKLTKLLCTALSICTIAASLTAQQAKQFTLSFETGLVMKNGDVKPVARQDFLLLDRDFKEILADVGYKPEKLSTITIDPIFTWWEDRDRESLPPARTTSYDRDHIALYKAAVDALRMHSVASTITDFGGKGKFSAAPGRYYIFSAAKIGNSVIVWSTKVDLNQDQMLTLENRNAALIF